MAIWTQEETDWLILNYPKLGKFACSEFLKRSEKCIRSKTSRLGLKQDRDSDFFADWQKKAAKSKIGKKRPAQALVMQKLHNEGKLKKNESQRQAISVRNKKWHKENEHPRGFSGGKHTKESKEKISQAFRNAWSNPSHRWNQEEYRQYLSDRMSKQHASGNSLRIGYSRGKIGKRKDLNDKYFRSSWEANYARYLNFLIKQNQIFKWEYEVDTFWFYEIKRGTRSYTPDFKIWETESSEPYYIEIKGWMDKKSVTKHKRMDKYYPNIKIVMIKKKEYSELSRKLKALIPNWEHANQREKS